MLLSYWGIGVGLLESRLHHRYSAEEITLDGEQFVHVSKHDIHLRQQRVTYATHASH
jgi:hypothetical protein